jgi:glycine/D-amino acid oxidase-like deaminating enzyme
LQDWIVVAGMRGRTMNPQRRKLLKLAADAAALPAISRVAWAQTYPPAGAHHCRVCGRWSRVEHSYWNCAENLHGFAKSA